MTSTDVGRVVRVAGPVVVAEGLGRTRLYNVVRVGEQNLIGEVIRLSGEETVIQVYEDTSGLHVGSPVRDTSEPLTVELGPGLLGNVFDGVQRPLPALAAADERAHAQPFIRRGVDIPALDRAHEWELTLLVDCEDVVEIGDVVATTPETSAIEHRLLSPRAGTITAIGSDPATVLDPVVWIDDEPVSMLSRWPVRRGRPFSRRLDPTSPLTTGQRVVDTLFPLARGGSATIPGGFGTGKTVHEQTLARWSDADVIVYVGCGERGNELAEVLEEFPELHDPLTGAALMERTILIANTSNMPVAAREASIYTGITLGEYYRDQGYDVALLADSTSRWGEALREVSSRLEEMPGEEGYPAYLPSRLAEFYERAGATMSLGRNPRPGSVSVIAAVSPPGGDFSEPVTQYSLRLAGTFWSLDSELARRRHFPAIHWNRSFTLYQLGDWFDENVAADWEDNRRWALTLLAEEAELQNIVQLLGVDALAPAEHVTFRTGQILREDFLQQSAFDEVDAFCPLAKQYRMLQVIRHLHEALVGAVRDDSDRAWSASLSSLEAVARMRSWPPAEAERRATELIDQIDEEVQSR
ncbi:MAG: V-type ATP synthase subunit A [Acidimicrobiia bacterium]|nr:V-type ATP synthase subunit A [Acidimicrobiia bacterium]